MVEKCWSLRNGRTLMMMKMIPSKATLIRFNLVLFPLSFLLYTAFILHPSSSLYFTNAASFFGCSFRDCHPKVERGVKMQELIIEDNQRNSSTNQTKLDPPSFIDEILTRGLSNPKIGIVNMDESDLNQWKRYGETIQIQFERVSNFFTWQDLFPEWIDEEEEMEVPSCPEIPMPYFESLGKLDLIVVKLPCSYPEEGWRREVLRLQVNLVAANLVAKKGKKDWRWKSKVLFWSKCRPMIEIFRCDDLEKVEGDWWFYRPDVARLQQKLNLPIGSCNLALPLWAPQGGIDEVYDLSKIEAETRRAKREAYATVLHSSESYVCGAITLAQSLRQTNTNRDLILLHDDSISPSKLGALAAAGWQLRSILRIRNPLAEKHSYNEYNYSKFRLWQLTDYDKVVFIDADIILLRNLDILFHFPQMSATGNDVWIFNSGIMVLEPSNCTFRMLMSQRTDIVSYNGGDQGFLNEIFVWWHRLPRRVNFLKNFWSNTTKERNMKNNLFASEPPQLYAVHYLGLKPWLCYRDYDCNHDVDDQLVYASDAAHSRWWKVHDAMEERLQRFCRLTKKRRTEINWERRKARLRGSTDYHWRINVTDPRRRRSYLIN